MNEIDWIDIGIGVTILFSGAVLTVMIKRIFSVKSDFRHLDKDWFND